MLVYSVAYLLCISISVGATDWLSLNLPRSHIPYYLRNHKDVRDQCDTDPECPYKDSLNSTACFGYEKDCHTKDQYKAVECTEKSNWIKSEEQQREKFWTSGDFGIVSEKRNEMKTLCSSTDDEGSYMECEAHARHCRGKNIVLDLRSTKASKAYDTEFIKSGEIGGKCNIDKTVIKGWNVDHRRSLQSWYQVMEHFTQLPSHDSSKCDITIDKPTYIIQNDAVVNMFHHFCDFVNLYVSQHLNSTTFATDTNVITWETTGRPFYDSFGAMWKVFSDNPVTAVGNYIGKTVCFKEVIFALPPRQRLGLFYNMPLIDGCSGSGLFRAFNEHVIHRLGIRQHGPLKDKIRITLLSRQSKHRNIINEQELVDTLNRNPKYEAKIVTYKFVKRGDDAEANFLNQIETTHNSDIFIGIHGAGLTHMLFLPHWAAVMEIYHCGDPKCYSTLARLRGVKYLTWSKMDKLYPEDEGHHPTLGAHEKFTNYSFEVGEFLRLIRLAADHVLKNKEYRAAKKSLYKPPAPIRDEL